MLDDKFLKTVLVTGSAGFIGKNLVSALHRRKDVLLREFDVEDDQSSLKEALIEADIIYHLAGVNRPDSDSEFVIGNVNLTADILKYLLEKENKPVIVLTSSIHATLDNPYGRSKKTAEDLLLDYNRITRSPVCIYRLPNVFGKWSRPDYNTVIATFCYKIARGFEITISDPDRELEFVYIDDVVEAFLKHLDYRPHLDKQRYEIPKTFMITLGDLADRIHRLKDIRQTHIVPDLEDEFMKCLHATYLSFLPEDNLSYPVKLNTDNRGWLFEFVKSKHFGQVFVSKTLPGITRGNHYHDTKIEKFCVVHGKGIIRFRRIDSNDIIEYSVDDVEIKIVDIPPGYTHSIENTSAREMIVLFWANQIFDSEKPDTYYSDVLQ